MKIFGRNDELFELMAKATQKQAAQSAQTPRIRSVSSHFGRATPFSPIGEPESEFVEIEGEALIVVEDDWDGEDEAPLAPVESTTGTVTQASTPIARSETLTRVFARTFSLRKDTLAIGGVFVGGLAMAMFLLGRSTASAPVQPTTPEVAVIQVEDPTLTPLPSEEASLLPSESELPAIASRGGSTALPASAPRPTTQRNAAKGKFDLLICYTTPAKGEELAVWLNEDPASPLAGKPNLEAVSRRGSVRIKGFMTRDTEVLKRVHQTRDPTGGSGTFSDAQWRNAK